MDQPTFPLWPRLNQWAKHNLARSFCLFGPFIVVLSALVGALIVPYGQPLEAALLCAVIGIGPAICIVAGIYYCRAARRGQLTKASSIGRLSLALLVGIPISGIILWSLHIFSQTFIPSREILGGENGMIIFLAPLFAFWIAIPIFLTSAVYIWRVKASHPFR